MPETVTLNLYESETFDFPRGWLESRVEQIYEMTLGEFLHEYTWDDSLHLQTIWKQEQEEPKQSVLVRFDFGWSEFTVYMSDVDYDKEHKKNEYDFDERMKDKAMKRIKDSGFKFPENETSIFDVEAY